MRLDVAHRRGGLAIGSRKFDFFSDVQLSSFFERKGWVQLDRAWGRYGTSNLRLHPPIGRSCSTTQFN